MVDLKKRRAAKQMTQEQVAEKVGIARESYTNIENGIRKPSVPVAKQIGSVLEFPWTEFYEEADDDD